MNYYFKFNSDRSCEFIDLSKKHIKEIRDQIDSIPKMTIDEVFELEKKVCQDNDTTAMVQLAMQNLNLSYTIALKYKETHGLDVSEAKLITLGNQGICDALREYDFTRGYRFSLTVPYYIKNRIEQEFLKEEKTFTSYTKHDLLALAEEGNLDGIVSFLNASDSDFDTERLVYKWLCVALDYGHTQAEEYIGNLIEVSNFRYDDDRIEQKKIHLGLIVDYANGKSELPISIQNSIKHVHLAIENLCNNEELSLVLEKVINKEMREELKKQISQL